MRQPPPYDSVPPHYDQQSSLSPSASIPAPSPAPPLLSDDRRRRRQTDQAPVSSPSASAVAAQSGYRAPASNRPERPPPPSDYLRQRGDNRQRDDAYVFYDSLHYAEQNDSSTVHSFSDLFSVYGQRTNGVDHHHHHRRRFCVHLQR